MIAEELQRFRPDSAIEPVRHGMILGDGEAYHHRGLAYEKKGEKAKAEKDFAQAKKLGYAGKQPTLPLTLPQEPCGGGSNRGWRFAVNTQRKLPVGVGCGGPPSFDNPYRWDRPGTTPPTGVTEPRWTTTAICDTLQEASLLRLWKRYHAHQIVNPANPVRCAKINTSLQSKKLDFQRSQCQVAVGPLAVQDILAGDVLPAAYQFHDGGDFPIVAQVDDQALRRRAVRHWTPDARLSIGVAELHVGRTFHWNASP